MVSLPGVPQLGVLLIPSPRLSYFFFLYFPLPVLAQPQEPNDSYGLPISNSLPTWQGAPGLR